MRFYFVQGLSPDVFIGLSTIASGLFFILGFSFSGIFIFFSSSDGSCFSWFSNNRFRLGFFFLGSGSFFFGSSFSLGSLFSFLFFLTFLFLLFFLLLLSIPPFELVWRMGNYNLFSSLWKKMLIWFCIWNGIYFDQWKSQSFFWGIRKLIRKIHQYLRLVEQCSRGLHQIFLLQTFEFLFGLVSVSGKF